MADHVDGNAPIYPTTIRREAGALATEVSSGGIPIRLWIATQFMAAAIARAHFTFTDVDGMARKYLDAADDLIDVNNETVDETQGGTDR